jgi:hypothetical protein
MTDPQYSPPPATPYAPAGGPQATKSPVLSILSLVGGIVGVLLSFFFGIGFIFSAAAVVLGFIGRRKEPTAKAMWLTGIILGFVGIAIALIIWIGLAVLAAVVGSASYSSN